MLILHHSNRLEALADELVELTRDPLPGLLTPERVVVQSLGMGRWLSMRLATQLGLCANVRFQFPASAMWDVFRLVLDDVPAQPTFATGVTTWHVMDLLAQLDARPGFAPLHAYLAGADDLRRWELARRIADTFDQYLVYRPDWIREWTTGTQNDWQAELWRRLAARVGERHRVDLLDAFAARLRQPRPLPADMPSRLSLFGIPSLPPAYIDAFARLAAWSDVHCFVTNPCRTFWEDVRSERQISRIAGTADPAALHLEIGHPLLASLGRQGREFLSLLAEHETESEDRFEDIQDDSLLHALQADILELQDRRGDPPRPADDSLQVHVCHGPLREVEVLHDQLLRLFERQPDRTPSQVVVMTPDIEAYAPAIDAVFGTAPEGRRIPFTIADRRVHHESPLAEAFFALLALPESRYEAGRIMTLLESPAVRRRFALDGADLTRIRGWVQDAGIRWGLDAEARAAVGVPAVAGHTWRFGLDRLLLGTAMADDVDRQVGGIVPFDDTDGGDALLIGRLHTLLDALGGLRPALAAPRAPSAWADALRSTFDTFLRPDDGDDADAQAVRDAIARLDTEATTAGFTAPVPLDLVVAHLRESLDVPGGGNRFLAGKVTFCALVPMRSIPFEVVCLIGMNDGAVPRAHRPVSFDRMADDRRRGDRSRRDDDRYLFLEALCSARRCFYLSYVGRDIHDDSERPPSVLVSDLLDVVRRGFGEATVADLVVQHPLQPFSRSYFDASHDRRVSYSEELCRASVALGGELAAAPMFFGAPLPAPPPELLAVAVEGLVQFLLNPSRFLLTGRLGLRIEEHESRLEPREPFVLDALESWHVRQALLAAQQRGLDRSTAAQLLQGRGLLPHGAGGEAVMRAEWNRVDAFAVRLADAVPAERAQAVPVELAFAGVQIGGVLEGVSSGGRLEFRLGRMRGRDRVALWVRHLILQAVAPPGVVPHSRWIGDGTEILLPPVPDAAAQLSTLCTLYREGLTTPLPFFPDSAWAYVDGKEPSLTRARAAWLGNEHQPGESLDGYFATAFRGRDPIDDRFAHVARTIFGPLRRVENGE